MKTSIYQSNKRIKKLTNTRTVDYRSSVAKTWHTPPQEVLPMGAQLETTVNVSKSQKHKTFWERIVMDHETFRGLNMRPGNVYEPFSWVLIRLIFGHCWHIKRISVSCWRPQMTHTHGACTSSWWEWCAVKVYVQLLYNTAEYSILWQQWNQQQNNNKRAEKLTIWRTW